MLNIYKMSVPTFDELIPDDPATISEIQRAATNEGFELLKLINSKAVWDKEKGDRYLQIATSESLTCGLIMSTLVDIPWGGFIKYGGFGVYDTDAKRVFNGVSVDDVYTHKCASEMAIGILKNSNATLAIAVTGNAMPLNQHVDMLGEVFIGIAGYNEKDEIIYETTALNMCTDNANSFSSFQETCKKWWTTVSIEKKYNQRTATATVSKEIRYYTVYKAYQQCINFINKHNPSVPNAILERKKQNESTSEGIPPTHTTIPNNKFDFGGEGICVNESCNISGDRNSEDVALYEPPSTFNAENSSVGSLQTVVGGAKHRRYSLHSNRHNAVVHRTRSARSHRQSRRGRNIGVKRITRSNNRINKRTISSR